MLRRPLRRLVAGDMGRKTTSDPPLGVRDLRDRFTGPFHPHRRIEAETLSCVSMRFSRIDSTGVRFGDFVQILIL